jgi:hypothetical protein
VTTELHRSLNNSLITKSSTIKEILDILFLGNKEAIKDRRNLNPKKIEKMTKIRYKKTKRGCRVLLIHEGSDIVQGPWPGQSVVSGAQK